MFGEVVVQAKGEFHLQIKRKGKIVCDEIFPNLITLDGLAYLHNVYTRITNAPVAKYHAGLINTVGFSNILFGDSPVFHADNWREIDVSDPRPEWIPDDTKLSPPTTFKITNSTTKSIWTVPSAHDFASIKGCFIVLDDDKPFNSFYPITLGLVCSACGGKGGMIAEGILPSPEVINTGDTLTLEYSISIT